MWTRIRRLVSSPLRAGAFLTLGFFLVGSAGLIREGLQADSGEDVTNGVIGVALFAFLILVTARAFDRMDAEDEQLRRERGLIGRPPRRSLRRYPRVVREAINTPGRAYIFKFLGLFLAVGVIALVSGIASGNLRALVVLPVIGLFVLLTVMAVGAVKLADERDGRKP